MTKLDQLADNPDAYNVISWKITRFLFIRDGKIGQYIYHLFWPSLKVITLIGFSGASIIAVFWLLFIRRIDYFDPEKKRYMLMLFCLGILTSFGVFVIDDFISIFTHIELSNKFLPDLFYCIFKIGLVEEVVKIIPFFVILFFTKQINESVDYFIYASVCAIGFAFAENLLYFSPYGISFISARGMISVSVHMIFSSITVYGLFYSKYKKNGKYPVLYFLLFLFLAALLHGLFDFFLVGPNYLRVLAIFSIAIFMFTIRIYSNILTTALNFSKFWNTAETEFEISNAFFLASFITYIGALEYFTLAWKCGPSSANIDFGQSLPLYILLIPYLASTIGILHLKQGAWINIFCLNNNKIEKLFVNEKI